MLNVSLDLLKDGFPAISKSIGQYLAEGGAFCLEANGHESGILLRVEGIYSESLKLFWSEDIDAQTRRAWNDGKEATEYGATAISLVIIKTLTPYTIIERSFQGTGFDYWLGTGEYDESLLPFEQRKAKLEISGIWKETMGNTVEARIRAKKNQITAASDDGLPALVIVVEFGAPKAKTDAI
jgi:hypothetical protein